MDDLTKEFLAESFEGLDRMDRCLTELELRPSDGDLLGEIFRAVHTIKGTTGFLGFTRLEKLAHAGETLLGALREGSLVANSDVVSGLLRLMDGLRSILRLIETTGREGTRTNDHDDELIALMMQWKDGRTAKPTVMGHGSALQAPQESGVRGGVADKTLRIDVGVLNRMVNLVGELVLTRNQILQSELAQSGENGGRVNKFAALARRLDSVTADLRETVMQARMQPVGTLFGKFPRMVRDLARECGKQVRIDFSGQETGLDKSLLEAIKDPLTHALRNAIDHGIETPEVRAAVGKAAEGVVCLRACHQNGWVVIEMTDDGAGISVALVKGRAIERGLISVEKAETMPEREARELIFLPGFSTVEAVSHISGRGVGMDVVRTNVERAGGTVELESREGRGTTLRLRVPLTLAIVPALVVQSGGQSFCLPQGARLELVCVMREEAATAVERIGDAELFRLRECLLPMVWLDDLLGLSGRRDLFCPRGFYVAVLESEGCRFGLVVDELMAPEEIVVKPISNVLREIGLFSGATVLGNGSLAMILDVSATAARAGVKPVAERIAGAQTEEARVKRPSFLVFEDRGEAGRRERMALPLEMVERIETVTAGTVERVHGRAVLQHRGELIALEDEGDVLRELEGHEEATVLICRRGSGRRVGLVVRAVVDVAEGEMLEPDVRVCTERLARVNDRLTVVRTPFASEDATSRDWRAVA